MALTAGSGVKLWWRCPVGADHRWQASVKARCALNTGCPMCAGHKVSVTNCLRSLYPRLSAELADDLNDGVTGADLTAKTHRLVWWRCPDKQHEYELSVAHRTAGEQNCPYCRGMRTYPGESLADLHPEIAAEFHMSLNKGSAFDYRPGSNKKVFWQCTKNAEHVWKTMILHRTFAGSGCPFCSGHKVSADTSLATLRPDVARELDPLASGFTADDVTAGSNLTAAWICSANPAHAWTYPISARTRPNSPDGCPFCSGSRAWEGNNLQVHFPEIASELDPDLNDGLEPVDVLPFSNKKLRWRCRRNPDHTWEQTIVSRTDQGAGCRQCDAGRRFSRIELQVAHLLAESLPVALDLRFLEVEARRRPIEVDIPIPLHKIVVEYDGGFHHQNRGTRNRVGRDERKNADLEAAGWRVLRVREAPLEKLRPWDIQVAGNTRDPATEVARRVLDVLVGDWGLPGRRALTPESEVRALQAAEVRIEAARQDKADRDAARSALAARRAGNGERNQRRQAPASL